MLFLAVAVWACCFAQEKGNAKSAPVTRFLPPWDFPLLEVADNCTILCGEWSALYLSVDDDCVGRDDARLDNGVDAAAIEKVRFCPNSNVIQPWKVEEELEFEAAYMVSEEFEQSELDVFNEMAAEREMKLSVHPWHMLLQEEIDVPQDRRRVTTLMGSTSSFRCFGGNGGGWRQHLGSRPTRLTVRHGGFIDRLEFTFANGGMFGGGGRGGGVSSVSLSNCIHYIYIRAGNYVDGLQFLGEKGMTPYYGGRGGGEYSVLAPSGKCLGDIKMKTGGFVDQICFKFNVSK